LGGLPPGKGRKYGEQGVNLLRALRRPWRKGVAGGEKKKSPKIFRGEKRPFVEKSGAKQRSSLLYAAYQKRQYDCGGRSLLMREKKSSSRGEKKWSRAKGNITVDGDGNT